MPRVIRLYTAAERDRDRSRVETVARLMKPLGSALSDWQSDPRAGWIGLDADKPSPLANAACNVENLLACATPNIVAGEVFRPSTADIGELVSAIGVLNGQIIWLLLEASNALCRLEGGG